jgi:hypothetical protein
MVTSISSISSASPASATRSTGGSASVALQDKLSRCEQQLGDWQACPSRKTPGGKKIIQDLQTQIRNLESRMASTGSPAAASTRQPATTASAAQAPGTSPASAGDAGTLGRTVDAFA